MKNLILILFFLPLFVSGQPILVNGWKSAPTWAHKASVTTDQTQFNGSDVSNFRFLITTTQTSMKTTTFGGSVVNTGTLNGVTVPYDLIITSDIGGSTLLNWEVEQYEATTGEIFLWVKLPNLSASSNITIYLHWGNPSVTTWQGGAIGSLYGGGAAMIHHLNSLTNDYSGNGNNGTNNGTTPTTSGKIASAASFNGTSNYLTIPYSSTLNCTSGITLHAWVNSSSTNRTVFGKMFAATHTSPFFDWNMYYAAGPRLNFRVGLATNSTTNTVSNSTWIHVVMVANGTDHRIYINGALDRTITTTTLPTNTNSQPVRIGANASPGEYFNGIIDEVEVFNTALSADWVAYSYTNQNNPASTYTFTLIF